MTNKIKQRIKNKAVCPRCKHPDYEKHPPFYEYGKPNYVCTKCGTSWQWGYDGGVYEEFL